ncbi:hypothetical protein ACGFX8_37790 [Streptomyces sp. NPDC048362]|uniref:hypothetical protein n=1 Tax=Streptomyces sp. NPDC048362 TaxID=3365539 RepID=UPI00371A737E
MGTANNNGQLIISYTLSAPSLTITKAHFGSFTRASLGAYRITVTNTGTEATDGTTVTVHDTLPTGLTRVLLAGRGWQCNQLTLTCTRHDVLAPGSSYPPITLIVFVTCRAPDTVTNTVSVTGGGDATTHTATDTATVRPNRLLCGR